MTSEAAAHLRCYHLSKKGFESGSEAASPRCLEGNVLGVRVAMPEFSHKVSVEEVEAGVFLGVVLESMCITNGSGFVKPTQLITFETAVLRRCLLFCRGVAPL